MKTRNTIYALLTVLMSMAGVSAFAHDISVVNSDGVTIYYTWQNNRTELAVSYRGNSLGSYEGNVVIPSSVTYSSKSYPVSSIGEHAFEDCSGLTSVTIPSSVTSIGSVAFSGCSGLTSVTIPNSVTNIGNYAFYGCSGLTSITIPNSVTSIVDAVFADCSGLTSVTIPNSVTSIGSDAFASCSGLTSVTIPNSVTSIGNSAFIYCSSLTSVTIPNSVTSIGNSAFCCCSSLTSIIIPNSVTYIGWGAFQGCSGLTSVTIPNSVTTIGIVAFSECSLTSIKVNSGNAYYDSRNNCNAIIQTNTNTLIAGCKNTVIPNSVTSIGIDAFYGCTGLTSITIPSSVTSIGYEAFYSCSDLTSVTIPNSVTSIGDKAFSGCSGLTSIKVNSGNAYYDSRNNCNAIIQTNTNTLMVGCKNTIIPNSVTSIGSDAFYGCSGLTSVTIPNSVTSIGKSAFYGCSDLTSVTVEMEMPLTITENVFSSRANATLYVPAGSKDAYEAADWWKQFGAIVEYGAKENITFTDANVKAICVQNWDSDGDGELSEDEAAAVTDLGTVFQSNATITSFDELQYFTGLTSIGEYAFYCCSGLTSVSIPNSVISIGEFAFESCNALTSINIPNSVTSIGWCAFENTAWYDNQPEGIVYAGMVAYSYKGTIPDSGGITINHGTLSISDGAFAGCVNLTSISIPSSVMSIGKGVFSNCNSLTSITVESGNTNYDSRDNCNAIIETASNTLIAGCKNTVIPISVTSIGDNAFAGCEELTSIIIPTSVTSIGNEAFTWCYGLTSITLPNSVTSIGNSAFGCCHALVSVTMPNSVTVIRNNTFGECESLTSVTIPNSVTSIEDYAFYDCSGLTSVTIPNSVTSIGDDAFSGCNGLTSVKVELETPMSIGSYTFTNSANATLYVPAGSKGAYEAADYWNEFKEIVEYGAKENITFADANVKTICVQNWDTDGDGELSMDEAAAVTSITNNSGFRGNDDITSFDELQYFTGLTSIGDYAFDNCDNLMSITFPNSLKRIGNGAFKDGKSLTSVTIPASVTDISEAFDAIAFYRSSGITSIVVEEGNPVYDSRDNCNAIIKTATNKLIMGCRNTVIPEGIDTIGMNAFDSRLQGVTSIRLPNSVTVIEHGAFVGGGDLTTLVLSENLRSIGSWSITSNKLSYIYLPESLTEIGDAAFYLDNDIKEVKVGMKTPVYVDSYYSFPSRRNAILYVPKGCKEAYETATCWKDFKEIIEYDENITFADANVKAICVQNWDTDGDGELSMDEAAAVTDLGTVFSNNTSITSFDELQYFTGLTSIADHAFSYCSNLVSFIFPNNIQSIGTGAFQHCSALKAINIPATVTSISEAMDNLSFDSCSGLTFITVEEGNSVYDSRNNCNAIIKTASNKLIQGCKTTIIPEDIAVLGQNCFSHMLSEYIHIPNSVTEIEHGVFAHCDMETIIFPQNINRIGSWCMSLDNTKYLVAKMMTPAAVYSSSLLNSYNTTLYVPKGSKAAYQSANYWKNFKAIVEFPDADVNQDGKVNVVDVVDIARFVVGTPSDKFVEFLADLNSDDEVNVADAVVLVNEIAGDQNFAKAYGAPRQNLGDDRLTLTENDDHSLSFSMESQRPYTAFQFDLYTNSEDDVMNLRLNTARKNGHQLLYNKVDKGHYRVVALSVANNGFNGNGGELLNIQLDGFNSADMTIGNIHFITTDGTDHQFDDLSLSSATGIESLTPNSSPEGEGNVYDLSGRKVSESSVLPKGVYVVNGKKVIVK